MKVEIKYVVSICQQRDLAVLCGHSLVVHSYTLTMAVQSPKHPLALETTSAFQLIQHRNGQWQLPKASAALSGHNDSIRQTNWPRRLAVLLKPRDEMEDHPCLPVGPLGTSGM